MSEYNPNPAGYGPVGWTCQFCGKWVGANELHDHGVVTGGWPSTPPPDPKDSELRRLRTLLAAALERETQLVEMLRERDSLWCQALTSCLSTQRIELVTLAFNKIRPDGAALLLFREKERGHEDHARAALARLFGEEKR